MTSTLSRKREATQEAQESKRKCTSSRVVAEHGVFKLLFIAWEDHDHDPKTFQGEIDTVLVLASHLGAAKTETHWIPSGLTGRDVSGNVRGAIEDFKKECLSTNANEIIMYSGHGGQGGSGQLVLAAKEGGGQTMEWRAKQLHTALAGPMATLLLMDCCFSGLAFKGPSHPCKLLVTACPEDGLTAEPGEDSFSSLLVRAGRSFNTPFTWEALIATMRKMAIKADCEVPVWRSYEGDDEIVFNPVEWVAQMRREKRFRFQQRRDSIYFTLRETWELLRLSYHDFATPLEVDQIASALTMRETSDHAGVYQAFRKIRDEKIIRGIYAVNSGGLFAHPAERKAAGIEDELC